MAAYSYDDDPEYLEQRAREAALWQRRYDALRRRALKLGKDVNDQIGGGPGGDAGSTITGWLEGIG